MTRSRLHFLTFVALLALPAADAAAQEAERYSIAGEAAAIYNLAGSVRIESGTGENVVVEVRRGGRDAARLEIERRDVSGRAALIVRYPDADVVYRSERWNGRTDITVRADGTFFGEGRGGDRIRISGSGRGTEAHADLRVLVPAGKAVYLRLGAGDVTATNVKGTLDIDVATANVATTGTRGAQRIDTGSGRVQVSDAEGDVIVDTGSGAVELERVRGRDLEVDTGSGAVQGTDIDVSGNISIDTGSGRIQLRRVRATDIELDTGSGSVELDLLTDVEDVRIDTGSGAVRLIVPDDIGAALELDTGSGGITVDVPVTITRRQRDHLTGRLGDGRGRIEIETGSGGIRITGR